MKKSFVYLSVFFLMCMTCFANNFVDAIKTCEKFSQDGLVPFKNQMFAVSVSLEKNRKGECIYTEKIIQGPDSHELKCKFTSFELPYLSDSMAKYNQYFKEYIQNTPIFSAKMTSNGDIFQNYLVNPKYCQITQSNNDKSSSARLF